MRLGVALLVLAVASAALVVAPEPAAAVSRAERKKAKAHYQRGYEHYNRGEYDEAIAELVLAISYERRLEFLYNIALAYEKKSDFKNARAYLEEVLERAPTRAWRKKARARLESVGEAERVFLSRGLVELRVTPDGARVAVDGEARGQAPLAPLELPVGRHEVRVNAPGFAEAIETVVVEGGERQTLSVALAPLTGLRLRVAHAGARVRVDGRDVGVGPLDTRVEVEVGRHEVVVEAEGYERWARAVDAAAGVDAELSVELERQGGRGWAWGVAGLGAAVAATGVVFHVLADDDQAEVDQLRESFYGKVRTITQREAAEAEGRAATNRTVSAVLYGVGGATMLGGLVWALVGSGDEEGEGSVSVGWSAHGEPRVQIGGRF